MPVSHVQSRVDHVDVMFQRLIATWIAWFVCVCVGNIVWSPVIYVGLALIVVGVCNAFYHGVRSMRS
jgi:hypothetical protein